MLVSEILRIKGNALFTTQPDAPVMDAVKCMADNDIGSLVVMDRGPDGRPRNVCRSSARGSRRAGGTLGDRKDQHDRPSAIRSLRRRRSTSMSCDARCSTGMRATFR
jgi:CBS domain-containing protein